MNVFPVLPITALQNLCHLVVAHSFLFLCLCWCISEIAICISLMPASSFIFAVILNADDFKMKSTVTVVFAILSFIKCFHSTVLIII